MSGEDELRTIREQLKRMFSTITAYLMPFPGENIARAKQNSSLKVGDIDRAFLVHLRGFVSQALSVRIHIIRISSFEQGQYTAHKNREWKRNDMS